MKRIVYLILLTTFSTSAFAYKSQQEVDNNYNKFYQKGDYISAYKELADYESELSNLGNNELALDYCLRIINLQNEQANYFSNIGIGASDYFTRWVIALQLGNSLHKYQDMIKTSLILLPSVREYAPELLPLFLNTVGYAYSNYTEADYRDSVYVLQYALDEIKKKEPTPELIQQYNAITTCFYHNRFSNSYKNKIFIEDKLQDCDYWFDKNRDYIDKLDTTIYKSEIISFYTNYRDYADIRAGSYIQKNDPQKSIDIRISPINRISSIKCLDETISQKIAASYASIGNSYVSLENFQKCKEYSDKAFRFLYKHNEDYDYCTILDNLSTNYWFIHNKETAVRLRKENISLREKLGYSCSCSDYSMLMLYNSADTTETIYLGRKLEEKYGLSESSMNSVYMLLGDAYSKKMHNSIIKGDSICARMNDNLAIQCFLKADSAIKKHHEYAEKYNLENNCYAELYNYKSRHYARKGKLKEALLLAKKSQELYTWKAYYKYADILSYANVTHDDKTINEFLPLYFDGLKKEIKDMIPVLGSSEFELFLSNHKLYNIPEYASFNPNNEKCLTITYDAALLSKGLVMNYASLAPFMYGNNELRKELDEVYKLRDSIYTIEDKESQIIAIQKHELKERSLRNKIKEQQEKSIYFSWKDVQAALNDNDVAIELVGFITNNHFWSTDSVHIQYDALIVNKNCKAPIHVSLFKQEQLRPVYELQPKSYNLTIGHNLYKSLWGKLAPFIKGKSRIFISPVGMLNLVSIESISDEDGTVASDLYNIIRVSSTKEICKSVNSKPQTISLYGGIDYNKSSDINYIDSLNTRGNWAYLINTKKEVEDIGTYCKLHLKKTNVYIGEAATEQTLKQDYPNVLHIATHGYYFPESKRLGMNYYIKGEQKIEDNLFYSGLLLAGAVDSWNDSTFKVNSNDGILSAYEISKLNLSGTDLVVLSACETGLGYRNFDGIIGLQRAFKLAGVKTIIMSLWKIDDAATSLFMTSFYKKWLSNMQIHDAFIEAQRIVRNKYKDPYYWAAFIMLD